MHLRLLDTPRGRTAVFAVLYASEGAPIGFIWWALPTLLRSADVPVSQITSLTAVLLLPWVLKFLWAPVLDILRGPRWGYRAWIVTAQLIMAGALVPLTWLDPVTQFDTWRLLLLIHAVAAATQDVAIDALVIGTTPPHERGRLNGAMQAGMLVGRSLFGGGVLLLGAAWGTSGIITALIVWICVPLILVTLVKEPPPIAPAAIQATPLPQALVSMFRLRATWIGLGFALTGAAAFEAAGQLAGPFLVDRDVATATIGVFFGVYVVSATLTGGLVGGWLSDRWGRVPALKVFLALVVASVAALGWVDLRGGASPQVLIAMLVVMYFCVGLFTVASYAFFMDLTHPRLGATQFTTFMAATNGCESWSAWAAGTLVASSNYGTAFLAMSLVSLLSLGFLIAIQRRPAP
jgi:PAT family beta-lactamase induction signal transducer AmpG